MKYPVAHPFPAQIQGNPLQHRCSSAWIAVLLLLTLIHSLELEGAVRFWDGGGANGFWSTAANWSNNVAPVGGDSLVFLNQTNRLDNSNRLLAAITNIQSITWLGKSYDCLSQLPIRLRSGLTNLPPLNGINTFRCDVILTTNQTWVFAGKSQFNLLGDVTLESGAQIWNVDLGSAGQLHVAGNLSAGLVSRITKDGPGILELNGSFNNVGNLVIAEGTLLSTGILNAITITVSNKAILGSEGTMSGFTMAGDLRPGGVGIRPTKLQLTSTTSSKFLPGSRVFLDLSGTQPGISHDQIECRSNPDLSGAQLLLTPSPSFNFIPGQVFMILTNTSNGLQSTTFLNLPENAQITNNGIVFSISYKAGSGNDVALKVISAPFQPSGITHVWKGTPQSGPAWSSPQNWNTSTTPQQNDSLLFPSSGTGRFSSNNLPVGTLLDQISFTGSGGIWNISGNNINVARGFLATSTNLPGEADINADLVTIPFAQQWTASNMVLIINSRISFQSNTLSLVTDPAGHQIFSKPFLGPGSMDVLEGRISFLKGSQFSNVTLRVRSGQVSFLLTRSSGAPWAFDGGTLDFREVIAPALTTSNCTLSVNSELPSSFSAALTLHPSSTFQFIINSISQPVARCDSIVQLNNATLRVLITSLDNLQPEIVLLRNSNNLKIEGTFKNLPEGATVLVETGNPNLLFPGTITYKGGQGNDIVLNMAPPPWSQKLIVWSENASNGLWSTPQNWSGNTAPGLADRVRFPSSASRFNSTNNLQGLTLESMDWQGSGYTVSGSLQLVTGLTMSSSGTNVWFPGELYSAYGPQVWNIANPRGVLHLLGGHAVIPSPTPPFPAAGEEIVPTDLFARFSLTKQGSGTLTLRNINIISPGDVAIQNGILDLQEVSLARAGVLRHLQGGLFLRGATATALVSSGGILRFEIAPESSTSNPLLRTTQKTEVGPDTIIQILPLPFPTPSLLTDQLVLNSPGLELLLPPPGQPISSEFVISSYSTGKRSGLLAGLSEGNTFEFGGHIFSIHYDVAIPGTPTQRRSIVLRKETTVSPQVQTITFNSNLQPVLEGTAAIRSLVLIESSQDLVHWKIIGQISSTDDQGIFAFTDVQPLETTRFYRASLP